MTVGSSPSWADGRGFSYQSWTPGTQLQLCRVPWDSTYRDIVNFDTYADLDSYLSTTAFAGSITLTNSTPVYPGRPVRVPLPLSDAYTYNYLRVYNPGLPGFWPPASGLTVTDKPREFYYFINDVSALSRDTTELSVQLDVWQTFGKTVTFGNSYCEQGHIGIANENQFATHGRTFLTTPEGLDIGSEYMINDWVEKMVVDPDKNDYGVLITASLDLFASGGDTDNPDIVTAKGTSFGNLPNGCNLYFFNSSTDYQKAMSTWCKQPWITSGITAINIVPSGLGNLSSTWSAVGHAINGVTCYELISSKPGTKQFMKIENFRNFFTPKGKFQYMKKFMTYPYSIIELTTNTGTPLVVKPEMVPGDDLSVLELAHFSPPDARMAFWVQGYNASHSLAAAPSHYADGSVRNDGGEWLDSATMVTNLPSMTIVNDGYLNYLASNKNGIAYQYASADWSQQKALRGNQNSYDQSSYAMNTNSQLNQVGINTANAQNALANQTGSYKALQSVGNSLVGGVADAATGNAGGVAGAALGIVNAGVSYEIQTNQNNQSTAINNNAANQRTSIQNDQTAYNRDTNKALGDWAANGDYSNAIAGINAKVQDAKMTQPTTSGQLGGEAFVAATVGWSILVKFKSIEPNAYYKIASIWARYGYSIDRFLTMPSNFACMSKFTYWKLKETYIKTATCPEAFKQTIRGIFEKGVTVWIDPSYIGTTDVFDNVPLSGISIEY